MATKANAHFVDCDINPATGSWQCSRGESVTVNVYPTLQALTAAEIPTTPSEPADTALAGAISVTTPAGLQNMTPGNHYSIDADINLQGVAWVPLDFDSANDIVIEGNNNTISNMNLLFSATENAFIESIEGTGNCEIRNLNFDNCTVAGKAYAAIFCAGAAKSASGKLKLTNINISNSSITRYESWSGIFMGRLSGYNGWISDCALTNCTMSDDTYDQQECGLFIGQVYEANTAGDVSNIVNCTVTGGSISASGDGADKHVLEIGGFVGDIQPDLGRVDFYNCSTSAAVNATCYQNAGAPRDTDGIGGFAGHADGAKIVTCNATGNITITTDSTWNSKFAHLEGVGGFIGTCVSALANNLEVTNCYSTGTITFNDDGTNGTPSLRQIGGFIGNHECDAGSTSTVRMLRCYSTSAITVNTDTMDCVGMGGFFGIVWPDPTGVSIERCWAEGDITINGDCSAELPLTDFGGFGGLMGTDNAVGTDILNCYCWGSITFNGTVSANAKIGGFLARHSDIADNTITNAYCAQTDTKYGSGYTGQIPNTANAEGFGSSGNENNIVLSQLFYDTQTGLSVSDMGTGQTTSWLQTQSNFEAVGWNFSSIWTMPPESVSSSVTQERVLWGPADYSHLNGESVQVLGDGAYLGDETVSSGAVALDDNTTTNHVGLQFVSYLQPMKLDGEVYVKNIKQLLLQCYNTLGGNYGETLSTLYPVIFRDRDDSFGSSAALFSGYTRLDFDGSYNRRGDIWVTQEQPLPMTVLGVVVRTLMEDGSQ